MIEMSTRLHPKKGLCLQKKRKIHSQTVQCKEECPHCASSYQDMAKWSTEIWAQTFGTSLLMWTPSNREKIYFVCVCAGIHDATFTIFQDFDTSLFFRTERDWPVVAFLVDSLSNSFTEWSWTLWNTNTENKNQDCGSITTRILETQSGLVG